MAKNKGHQPKPAQAPAPPEAAWRQVALEGDFGKTATMLQGMVASDWPELVNRIYIREYAIPGLTAKSAKTEEGGAPDVNNDAAAAVIEKDERAYQEFLVKALAEVLGQRPVGLQDDDIKYLERQAKDLYANVKDNAGIVVRDAERGEYGLQQGHTYTIPGVYDPDDGREIYPEENMKIAVLSISADKCPNCTTSIKARMGDDFSCQAVTPDGVFRDRMEYFATATHELAHAVRDVLGEQRYGTESERRAEESSARVFENLMVAKTFGAAGLLFMQENIYNLGFNQQNRYEAIEPLKAALEIASGPDGLSRYSPRQLLTLAEDLVRTHDVTANMTIKERLDYQHFVELAPHTPEEAKARLNREGPHAVFNQLSLLETVKPDSGPEYFKAYKVPYTPAMEAFDRNTLQGDLVAQDLERLRMRLNPLRPPELNGSYAYNVWPETPEAQAALEKFTAGMNHPSCNIPQVIKDEQKRREDEYANYEAAEKDRRAPQILPGTPQAGP